MSFQAVSETRMKTRLREQVGASHTAIPRAGRRQACSEERWRSSARSADPVSITTWDHN